MTGLYVFASHSVQATPSSPWCPVLHRQLFKRLLPIGDWEFEGQLTQEALPVSTLYFPASHAEQAAPLGPVYPAWHRQLVCRLLPAGDCAFDRQDVHMSAAEAPVVAEYVLAPQSTQVLASDAPGVGEYVPAPQFVQVLATEAPVVPRNLPAPQSVHVAEPMASLYFPTAHAEQFPPSAPVYPAWH